MPRKPKATAPAKPAKSGKPATRPRRKGITGTSQPLPGTEQHHDQVLESEFINRSAAISAAALASEAKATAEANIQARFEALAEADPEDPRAKAYTVESGETLFPWKQPKLRIRRAPSKQTQAEQGTRAPATEPTTDDGDEPDLPDDLDDLSAYRTRNPPPAATDA